jgi:hypothetical protein
MGMNRPAILVKPETVAAPGKLPTPWSKPSFIWHLSIEPVRSDALTISMIGYMPGTFGNQ